MGKISREALELALPDEVEPVWIDGKSGARSCEGCAGAILMPFQAGTAPERCSGCGAAPP